MLCTDCTKHKICKAKYELDNFLKVFAWFACSHGGLTEIEQAVVKVCSEVDPIKE